MVCEHKFLFKMFDSSKNDASLLSSYCLSSTEPMPDEKGWILKDGVLLDLALDSE